MNPHHYQLFGTGHLASLAFIFIAGIVIIYSGTKLGSVKQKNRLAVIIGLFLIIPEIPDFLYRTYVLFEPVKDNLPLHLCGISLYITALALFLRKQILFEIAYFWGLGGALLAVLSPGDIFYFPHILNIIFYSSHGLIIIGALYMAIVLKFRPTPVSLVRVGLINLAYVMLIYPVNFLIDANYLFLRFKPKGTTLINHMGPWPVYVAVMILLGFISYIILYLPYFLHDVMAKRSRKKMLEKP